MAMIHYVDPAGNMTAIVRGEFGNEKRVELAKQILQQEKAEQVGFEVPPVNGGDCRLEMMGGRILRKRGAGACSPISRRLNSIPAADML